MKNNLQDVLMEELCQKQIPVTVYTINGAPLKGTVVGYDCYVIVLNDNIKGHQMVYKHAISTIVPAVRLESVMCAQ